MRQVIADFPGVTFVLAHGGRGQWYDEAAEMALAASNVWLDLAGLPPKRLPDYYAAFDLTELARKWIFGTDWPGVPGVARNVRAVAALGLPGDVLAGVLHGHAAHVYLRASRAAGQPRLRAPRPRTRARPPTRPAPPPHPAPRPPHPAPAPTPRARPQPAPALSAARSGKRPPRPCPWDISRARRPLPPQKPGNNREDRARREDQGPWGVPDPPGRPESSRINPGPAPPAR